MIDSSPGGEPEGARWTLFTLFTALGDLIALSLLLFILWAGVVTAAPASAGALEARRHIGRDGSAHPVRTMLSATRAYFSRLWFVGPGVLIVVVMGYIALAFWLTTPSPIAIGMVAVVVAALGAIFSLAMASCVVAPGARHPRAVLGGALRLCGGRALPTVLAAAAAAAVVYASVQFPQIGIVAGGAAMTEIAFRAWGRTGSHDTGRATS